jgi:uncharacterized repeat protein (TIGR02543 family)
LISASVPVPTPTKAGYVFAGWYFEAECTTPIGTELATATDTLYAKWTAHSTAPTSAAVHTLATKTIVYTFSEEVMLIEGNSIGEDYPGVILRDHNITHDLFGIFELDESYEYVTSGDPALAHAIAGATVSALTWNAAHTIATFTYTGTIPEVSGHHYVIDTMDYTIADVAGVEHAAGVASTFEAVPS